MTAFRVLLALMFAVLSIYTLAVIFEHGLGLFPIFFGDMVAVNWPGQFNLDFMFMLMISALWVSWRHHFSAAGLGLGLIAFFGGIGFLSIYLFIMSFQTKGDARALLIGDRTL